MIDGGMTICPALEEHDSRNGLFLIGRRSAFHLDIVVGKAISPGYGGGLRSSDACH